MVNFRTTTKSGKYMGSNHNPNPNPNPNPKHKFDPEPNLKPNLKPDHKPNTDTPDRFQGGTRIEGGKRIRKTIKKNKSKKNKSKKNKSKKNKK